MQPTPRNDCMVSANRPPSKYEPLAYTKTGRCPTTDTVFDTVIISRITLYTIGRITNGRGNKEMMNNTLKLTFGLVMGVGFAAASFLTTGFAATTGSNQEILSQAPGLSPQVLQLGIKAYDHAKAKGMDQQGILTIIDYSKPSTAKRLWVIDINNSSVLANTLVAHGAGSGNNYATKFSDQNQTHESSIGVFLTGHTYIGKHNYSLRLHGLEKGFNDRAYKRAIVMHSAVYVSQSFAEKYGRIGRSWGCPALSTKVYKKVINDVKDGSIIMAYYPNQNWLAHSQYV